MEDTPSATLWLERQAGWVEKTEKLFAIGLPVVVVVDAVVAIGLTTTTAAA